MKTTSSNDNFLIPAKTNSGEYLQGYLNYKNRQIEDTFLKKIWFGTLHIFLRQDMSD